MLFESNLGLSKFSTIDVLFIFLWVVHIYSARGFSRRDGLPFPTKSESRSRCAAITRRALFQASTFICTLLGLLGGIGHGKAAFIRSSHFEA